jgi:ferredoxin
MAMAKTISHVVRRPGRRFGDTDVNIPVAEDLSTVPGIPVRENDVSFYSRVYPQETQNIEKAADREWVWTVYSEEMAEYRHYHDSVSKPLIDAAAVTGELEPVATPDPSVDVTTAIRTKARELGFGEVGFTKYDKRYTYTGKRRWIKYPNAICLALEQNYVQTQSLPSMDAEFAHFGTYEIEGALLLDLTDYIRTLGYHAQVHSPNDNSAPYIPMFVSAGLGQLGANGQLLSPHFGSRARLAIITTDAPVNYDEPVDYGIHKFCQVCQVCVNRCPGRAIIRDKVWWRGAEKNKLIYERCRPVMARYEGCAVCMKTCPIQRFGMKEVMEYYVATGEVLGKGTHLLEGYTIEEKGYFGPGDLPMFDRSFFEIPHGRKEEWLFDQFKEKLMGEGIPSEPELVEFAQKVRGILVKGNSTIGDE